MNPPHVLVAEDQMSLRLLFAATLQRAGLRVTTVENGQHAIDVVRRDRPDLVMLDVGLPVLDGLEVCRAVRADPSLAGTTLMLVTGRRRPHELAAGFAAGADAYLIKPFTPGYLVEEVHRWLAVPATPVEAPEGGVRRQAEPVSVPT